MARKRGANRGRKPGKARSQRRDGARQSGSSLAPTSEQAASFNVIGLGAVLVVASFLAYWSILDNQLTNWDDPQYIHDNPYIKDLSFANIRAIFSSVYIGNYHPLTLLSLALDHAIGGMEPAVYHGTALILHTIVSLLVFALARQLLRGDLAGFLVGLLFAVHPLHVESVAWASGRKDLLFALFFFASLLFYLRHCRTPAQQPGRMYALALLCFVLSLLSKGQAVALAPTLVALDWIEGRRLLDKRVVVEKLPFFALALGFGLLAVGAQRVSAGQLVGEFVWGPGDHFVFACYGYIEYLVLLIAPHGLTAWYPYPHPSEAANGLPLAYLVRVPLVAAWIGVFAWSLRHARMLAFSIAFFTLNVVFVLQLLPIGSVIMADRYTYVASFGIFLAMGAGAKALVHSWPGQRIAIVALALAYAAGLAFVTHRQCDIWQDSASLWNDVLAKHPQAAGALINRANLRYHAGDLAGAKQDLDEMIRLWPQDAKAFGHRAVIRHQTRDLDGAISDMSRAIELAPSAGYYSNRGSMRVATGDLRGAIDDFTRALELNPEDVTTWSKRGWTLGEVGNHRDALADYQRVVTLAPGWAEGHFGVAGSQLRLAEYGLARPSLERAIALDPSFAEAYLLRGELEKAEGRRAAACEDLVRAARLGADTSRSPLSLYCGN